MILDYKIIALENNYGTTAITEGSSEDVPTIDLKASGDEDEMEVKCSALPPEIAQELHIGDPIIVLIGQHAKTYKKPVP